MAFSYDQTLSTAKDRIRLALGDTVPPGLRSDEVINAMVAAVLETEATARLAESLAAEYAQKPSSLSDDTGSITWGERVKTWLELAKRMRAIAADSGTGGSTFGSVDTEREHISHNEYGTPANWYPKEGWYH